MSERTGDVWVAYDCRWINLSRLCREASVDPLGFPIQLVKMPRRFGLVHRAIEILRHGVSQVGHRPGKVGYVLRCEWRHDDRSSVCEDDHPTGAAS